MMVEQEKRLFQSLLMMESHFVESKMTYMQNIVIIFFIIVEIMTKF